MSFHEELFPVTISKGAKLVSEHGSVVQRLASGSISSVSRWPNELWSFDVGFGIRGGRTFTTLREVHKFWQRRQGHGFGFLFENPFENSTAADGLSAPSDTDVIIGEGDGTTDQFQMVKLYTDATGTTTRTITKPKDLSVVVAVDGTPQVHDTGSGGDFTYDPTTGILLFDSGSIPTGGGSPQVITFGCYFYLPAKFGPKMRGLALQLETKAGEIGRAPSIPIVEMSSSVVTPDLPYRGGSTTQSFGADLIYGFQMGQFVPLNATATGLNFVLPEITDLPLGGPIVTLKNIGSNSITVVNRATGATEATLAASIGAEFYCTDDSGTKTWENLKGL